MEDDTICPVCLKRYSQTGEHIPRLLNPCNCTVCEQCLEKLIVNGNVVCPVDRQVNPAPHGVKTFNQNKYLLPRIPRKSGDCPVHDDMSAVLFCKEPDCNKAICQLCVTEGHVNHKVVNHLEELEELKASLKQKVDGLKDTLNMQAARAENVKRHVEEDMRNTVQVPSKRCSASLSRFSEC